MEEIGSKGLDTIEFYQLLIFPIGSSWTIAFSLPIFFSGYLSGFWMHIKVFLIDLVTWTFGIEEE